MSKKLGVLGAIVGIYFVFFLNAILVWNAGYPDEIQEHFLGPQGLVYVMYAIYAVVPVHLGVVIWAVVKKKIALYLAFPFFLVPYMVAVTIQGLVF